MNLPAHPTLTMPPISLGDAEQGPAPPLTVPERLLHLLQTPVCRWDLSAPLPTGALPEALLEELQHQARIGYLNPAAARLFDPETTSPLTGSRLGALPGAIARPEALLVRRFLAGRCRLTNNTIRLAAPDGTPELYRVSWEGVTSGGRLTAIWVVLEEASLPAAMPESPAVPRRQWPGSPDIVGTSASMQRVLEKIAQVAPTDSTVLLRGETGTGKELLARTLHNLSPRRGHPLVAVNCGALARGVVESELFGHEKGAFTGAVARKIGHIELADGGTLLLDEIGDLPLDLQVKLLRVLQEGEVVRVGATVPVRVNVRVVAATHRDLAGMVQRGEFRQDLYYRLNVFPVQVPALRDRAEDIPELVRHFTSVYAHRLGKVIDTIPSAVVERLGRFPWPGNIRELANVIERSVIITPGTTLVLAEWATGQTTPVTPAGPSVPSQALLAVEREHILRTLEACGWKVSGPGGAADRLGLKATTLEARMKRLTIARPRR